MYTDVKVGELISHVQDLESRLRAIVRRNNDRDRCFFCDNGLWEEHGNSCPLYDLDIAGLL